MNNEAVRCFGCGKEVNPVKFRGRIFPRNRSTILLRLFTGKSRIKFATHLCTPCTLLVLQQRKGNLENIVHRLLP